MFIWIANHISYWLQSILHQVSKPECQLAVHKGSIVYLANGWFTHGMQVYSAVIDLTNELIQAAIEQLTTRVHTANIELL